MTSRRFSSACSKIGLLLTLFLCLDQPRLCDAAEHHAAAPVQQAQENPTLPGPLGGLQFTWGELFCISLTLSIAAVIGRHLERRQHRRRAEREALERETEKLRKLAADEIHRAMELSASFDAVNVNKLLEKKSPATAVPAQTVTSQSIPRGTKILLAEDGIDNQRLVSFLLRRAGADVTVVEHGQAAVVAVEAAEAGGAPFELILMDMQMPVLDGYDATNLLRNKGYRGGIIAFTAYVFGEDREKCLAAGCDDIIAKPIVLDQFFRTVVAQLEKAPVVESELQSENIFDGTQIPSADIAALIKTPGKTPSNGRFESPLSR